MVAVSSSPCFPSAVWGRGRIPYGEGDGRPRIPGTDALLLKLEAARQREAAAKAKRARAKQRAKVDRLELLEPITPEGQAMTSDSDGRPRILPGTDALLARLEAAREAEAEAAKADRVAVLLAPITAALGRRP